MAKRRSRRYEVSTRRGRAVRKDVSRDTANRGETVYAQKRGRYARSRSRHAGGRKSTTSFNRLAFDPIKGIAKTVRRLKQLWR